MAPIHLADLLTVFDDAHDAGHVLTRPSLNPLISAPPAEDDRLILPGGLFVARAGATTDGHDRIPAAIAKGAAAVIGERPFALVECSVPYVQVTDSQRALGWLAAAYYDHPSRQLTVIGVTGTDGKTTTSTLIYSILKQAGVHVGLISTVSALIGDEEFGTGLHVTTPAAPDIQRLLRQMVDSGLSHCVLETTSHGLAQGRVRGVEYDTAVLTNLTHEHLDFHGSFEAYREAKRSLFRMTRDSFRKSAATHDKTFVINADDPNASLFAADSIAPRTFYYTLLPGAPANRQTFQAMRLVHTPTATHITINFPARRGATGEIHTSLIGEYNVANVLAAIGAVWPILGGGDWRAFSQLIQAGLDALPAIPGRMERIDGGQDFIAIVDFAHTPNALVKALTAARTLVDSDRRVIAVFGCAGLRDREKRPLMAASSATLADVSIFTAEDPRTESLDAILATMADAAVGVGSIERETFWRIPDRGQALAFACSIAQPGDVVIACGKGHEQSMCFGATEYPWDDRDALRAALRGTPLRTLPTAELM